MDESQIMPGADAADLQQLPRVSEADRMVLERLIVLAPDMAVATASAVLRTHQGDLHDLFFPPQRRHSPRYGRLAAALVYLALAMSAPAQGKFMPILSKEDFQRAWHARDRLLADVSAARTAIDDLKGLIPDAELASLLEAFIGRLCTQPNRDPVAVRVMVMASAGAFYLLLANLCTAQFRPSVDLNAATALLARAGRTRELLEDALAPEAPPLPFDPAQQQERMQRLREFGWEEYTASAGHTLQEIAQEAMRAGMQSDTLFALTDEWTVHGASMPTSGGRYFMRPALLPDSTGLSLSAQEERLKPVQRVLGGDPAQTGLRIGLGTVELLLEYLVRTGRRDFLIGRWTRTANQFDGLHTRLGLPAADRFAITLCPRSRRDESVGIWPVIEVEDAAMRSSQER